MQSPPTQEVTDQEHADPWARYEADERQRKAAQEHAERYYLRAQSRSLSMRTRNRERRRGDCLLHAVDQVMDFPLEAERDIRREMGRPMRATGRLGAGRLLVRRRCGGGRPGRRASSRSSGGSDSEGSDEPPGEPAGRALDVDVDRLSIKASA